MHHLVSVLRFVDLLGHFHSTAWAAQTMPLARPRSRAQSLVPPEDASASQGRDAGGSSGSSAAGDAPTVEALVPGLDFCNHAAGPACRWEQQGDRVGAVRSRACCLSYTSLLVPCQPPGFVAATCGLLACSGCRLKLGSIAH